MRTGFRLKVLSLAITSLVSTAVFANDKDLPNLPDYYAERAPAPPLKERVSQSLSPFKDFYLTPKIGLNQLRLEKINRLGPFTPGLLNPTVAQSSANGSSTSYSINVGFAFPNWGYPSRVELEYINFGDVKYNPNPALNNTTPTIALNSTIHSQAAMFNIYHDFSLWSHFVPYIGGGAGFGFNHVDSTATATGLPTVVDSQNKSNFAWNLRAGVKIKITSPLAIDLGYQYFNLGKSKPWQLQGPNQLKIDSIQAHNLSLGLVLQMY